MYKNRGKCNEKLKRHEPKNTTTTTTQNIQHETELNFIQQSIKLPLAY